MIRVAPLFWGLEIGSVKGVGVEAIIVASARKRRVVALVDRNAEGGGGAVLVTVEVEDTALVDGHVEEERGEGEWSRIRGRCR